LDTTSEVSPEVSPDLPHICREKRKHEINTQNLPMKKREINFSTRNLQAEILSQHTPWVGTLTQVHKNIISDKKMHRFGHYQSSSHSDSSLDSFQT
jgi:hypothetical protein